MKHLTFLFVLASIFTVLSQDIAGQSVGIGTASPNNSSLLDLTSNSKGILVPRMTQTEVNAIISPAQGLMVYNTSTNSFQYHNGSGWNNVSHSGLITGTANRIPKFSGPWALGNGMMTDNNAGVSINSGGTPADPSALLDLSSTTKGVLIPRMTTAQRTAMPAPAIGLLVFDMDTMGFWFYNGNWTQLTGSGSSHWTQNGNSIYSSTALDANVGIGILDPQYKLDVSNNARMRANLYIDGYLGIGTESPVYKLTVEDGSVAIRNTTDNKIWVMQYSTSSNALNFAEDGVSRMTIANGGNVGIGTTAPDQKLDVVGTAAISGTLTVNNNKGVMYNLQSATNLKHYTRSAQFGVNNLAPGAISAEGSIGFSSGFTSPPQVYVGNMTGNGGTAGQLYSLGLIIYNVTTTGCNCRIINYSNTTITQEVIWNIMCIGQ